MEIEAGLKERGTPPGRALQEALREVLTANAALLVLRRKQQRR